MKRIILVALLICLSVGVASAKPDLVVENVGFKNTDLTVLIEFDIKNIGDEPAEALFPISILGGRGMCQEAVYSKKNLDDYEFNQILPGESIHVAFNNCITYDRLENDSITITVDSEKKWKDRTYSIDGSLRDNMVDESREDNNEFTYFFIKGPKPGSREEYIGIYNDIYLSEGDSLSVDWMLRTRKNYNQQIEILDISQNYCHIKLGDDRLNIEVGASAGIDHHYKYEEVEAYDPLHIIVGVSEVVKSNGKYKCKLNFNGKIKEEYNKLRSISFPISYLYGEDYSLEPEYELTLENEEGDVLNLKYLNKTLNQNVLKINGKTEFILEGSEREFNGITIGFGGSYPGGFYFEGHIVHLSPSELWVMQGEEIRILTDDIHILEIVDVTEMEDMCGISIDEEVVWINVGDEMNFDGLVIGARDAMAVHGQLQDTDLCKIYFYNDDQDKDLSKKELKIKEGNQRIFTLDKQHIMGVENVTGEGTKCKFRVDDKIIRLGHGRSEDFNGLEISLENHWYDREKNKDVCVISYKDSHGRIINHTAYQKDLIYTYTSNSKIITLMDREHDHYDSCWITLDGKEFNVRAGRDFYFTGNHVYVDGLVIGVNKVILTGDEPICVVDYRRVPEFSSPGFEPEEVIDVEEDTKVIRVGQSEEEDTLSEYTLDTHMEITVPAEQVEVEEIPIKGMGPVPCNGCKVGDSCLTVGTRLSFSRSPSYCNISNLIKPQLIGEENCMNDFECLSNRCLSGKCSEPKKSWWQWLLNLFAW